MFESKAKNKQKKSNLLKNAEKLKNNTDFESKDDYLKFILKIKQSFKCILVKQIDFLN